MTRLKASGRTLRTIFISHGDPDYGFGLETLLAAFPGVQVLATAPTVAHIEATRADKRRWNFDPRRSPLIGTHP